MSRGVDEKVVQRFRMGERRVAGVPEYLRVAGSCARLVSVDMSLVGMAPVVNQLVGSLAMPRISLTRLFVNPTGSGIDGEKKRDVIVNTK